MKLSPTLRNPPRFSRIDAGHRAQLAPANVVARRLPQDRAARRAHHLAEMRAWEASGGDVARADAVHPEAFGAKILLS